VVKKGQKSPDEAKNLTKITGAFQLVKFFRYQSKKMLHTGTV
jgi:hypothetical protein